MALLDKQPLGTWNVTGDKLLARTFDEGTTFFIVQQKVGPTATEDQFILRQEEMLDRDDVTLTVGLDVAATKALLTDLTWADGTPVGSGLGLGREAMPTNFPLPNGYAQSRLSDGTFVITKAVLSPSSKTVAASTEEEAAAAKKGWLVRNLKWVVALAATGIAAVVTVVLVRKGNKKKK